MWVYIGLGKMRSLSDCDEYTFLVMVGETNLWGWVCDWAEAGSEQGEEGVGKKVESKF